MHMYHIQKPPRPSGTLVRRQGPAGPRPALASKPEAAPTKLSLAAPLATKGHKSSGKQPCLYPFRCSLMNVKGRKVPSASHPGGWDCASPPPSIWGKAKHLLRARIVSRRRPRWHHPNDSMPSLGSPPGRGSGEAGTDPDRPYVGCRNEICTTSIVEGALCCSWMPPPCPWIYLEGGAPWRIGYRLLEKGPSTREARISDTPPQRAACNSGIATSVSWGLSYW